MEEELKGLSAEEVIEKRSKGEGECQGESITRTPGQIVRDNLCTRFNALNFLIAVLLFAAGAYSNMLFIGVIILNILIGIAQELKAKKLVDELSILNRPRVRVIREGKEQVIGLEEVVKDDLTVLQSGDQICSDSVVADGELEVNESLLTGESDGVGKGKGDMLYSGSFVISGKARARVTHVGNENYAAGLAKEVKREKQVQSELLSSMRRVTNFTSFLIVPMGLALFLEALLLRQTAWDEAIVSSAAALLGMLPKGLVLLISVSLAAGVIRLGKMKILVQNIHSLETLAHVDVLCLDKTGTITDGNLEVCRKVRMPLFDQAESGRLAESYTAACDDGNATFQALLKAFPPRAVYTPVHKIPFSSKRKWGSVSFRDEENRDKGTVFVGAPEKFRLNNLPEDLDEELERGMRIVVMGYAPGVWKEEEELPEEFRPIYCLVLKDTIRKDAKKTLEFFRKEGVEVKIISGDHVTTVSQIARRAGLERWREAVDLSALGPEIDYDGICRRYAVFARTTPRQKQELIQALKRQGRQVAMTGDGVNDLLALREADCSIAVADGSDASRQLSQIVLLDSDFTCLPQVVMEGRRVIHNITRTAGVFFIKTIYSLVVSAICLLTNVPFPFIPIQITLVDAFVEAYPSFLTILERDTRPIKGRFLKTAVSRALPYGLAAAGMIAFVSLAAPFGEAGKQTVMYLSLILISMTAVIKSCLPFTPLRAFVCVTMAAGCFGALGILPDLFQVTALSSQMAVWLAAVTAAAWVFLLIADGIRKIAQDSGKRAQTDV